MLLVKFVHNALILAFKSLSHMKQLDACSYIMMCAIFSLHFESTDSERLDG